MLRHRITGFLLFLVGLSASAALCAQDPSPPSPTEVSQTAEPEKKEAPTFRPIESNVIINLPSAQVSPAGTFTLLVTHRFTNALSTGTIQNFFTLDSGNVWGFGLWYVPVKNLSVGFYRSSDNGTYEASAQYELPRVCGFDSSLRVGEDWRTTASTYPQKSFFMQAVLAYSFGPYARITAVPTYLQRTYGELSLPSSPNPGDESCRSTGADPPLFTCHGIYANTFNVPVGLSVAITHSITIHGEVTPRLGKANASGVGWSATVEKSLLRHRFAFFVGNQRKTTVDQYSVGVARGDFIQPKDIYIGFNLYRAWKMK